MALANDSILVTPGTGATVATHALNSKEHQLFIPVEDTGHLVGTAPTYSWWVPTAAVGASKLFADIFNPAASGKRIEIRGMWAIPRSDVAVTGLVAVEIMLFRTSAAGTGGTAYTYNGGTVDTSHVMTPFDTASTTALTTSLVTARSLPTGGATIAALYWPQFIYTEETNAATYIGAYTNLLPVGSNGQRITLNEGQGLLIKQGTVASVGSVGFLTLFTLV